jgi:thioredoxin 1
MTAFNLTSAADFDIEVVRSEVPVLVDFWASWCAPCRMVSPILEEISSEHSATLKVVKVNVDDHKDIAETYGITSVPTMSLFRDGEVVKQLHGAKPKRVILTEFDLV